MDASVLDRVRSMAEDMLRFAGMELVHLESQRHPGGWVLRLFIDKEGGVTLDDCARVSRQLSAQLDIENPIEHPYTLEVSSPGLDRALHSERDYERFSGRRIRLTTYAPIAGRRNFQGRLDGFFEGAVRLTLDGGQAISVPMDQVAKARLELDIE